jgi:hypothetical protein
MLEEVEFQPCIVYIPNSQDMILESKTQYKHFKLLFKRLEEKTKGGSVIISCIENSETSGESGSKGKFPAQSMMIASKSSTTLLDFSLFDHFSKNEGEKGSYNKNSKLLKKIMPTTITINPPSKPSLLNEWRQQIEKDVKSIKKQNNLTLITKLMSANRLTCNLNKINSSYLENYTLSTFDAHKIIGWALSHHIMNQHDQPTSSLPSSFPLPSSDLQNKNEENKKNEENINVDLNLNNLNSNVNPLSDSHTFISKNENENHNQNNLSSNNGDDMQDDPKISLPQTKEGKNKKIKIKIKK